jgi:hypothetical protein
MFVLPLCVLLQFLLNVNSHELSTSLSSSLLLPNNSTNTTQRAEKGVAEDNTFIAVHTSAGK